MTPVVQKESVIDSLNLDLSLLLGRSITLFSDQFQGRPMTSKVIMVGDRTISVDRGGCAGQINQLLHNQPIIVQFEYKGQRLSVNGTLKRSAGGRCNIVLADKVVPLSRRRFRRFDVSRMVKCAVLPTRDFDTRRLNDLRWIETVSRNFSSGGLLLMLPTQLPPKTYLLLSIEFPEFNLPSLMIGQVKYCYPADNFTFGIGVEFITAETKDHHFSQTLIQKLPSVAFKYDNAARVELNRKLMSQIPII